MLGIPTDEIKAAAQHVDRTLSEGDRLLIEVRAMVCEGRQTLAVAKRILENVEVLTAVIRASVQGQRPQG